MTTTQAPLPATAFDRQRRRAADEAPGPLGSSIAASLGFGAVLAAAMALGPLAAASEATVVGAALVAFASGWAVMAVATTVRTQRPQRWAAVPAAVLGVGGAALLVTGPGEPTMSRLAWVWAPALVVLAGWVGWRTRSQVRGPRALLLHPLALLMALAGVGGMHEVATQPADAAVGPMPGTLFDVGGYRLHLDCAGTGSPTVVLLNGLQETSPHWSRVAPRVASSTRVCAYDRAGQGWSDDSPNPADAAHVTADLHALLAAAGESGPYVLAGHSSGGVYALTYASRHPRDVVGMVLLDSASPRQAELVPSFAGEYAVVRRAAAIAPSLARTGIWHAATPMYTPSLAAGDAQQAARFAVSPRGLRSMRAEHAVLPTSFRQAQALTTLGSTPLAVLTAQETVDRTDGWGTAQDQLAALSTNARHVVADLGHVALLDDPTGAALSASAITDVVVAARTSAPLTASLSPSPAPTHHQELS